MKLMARGSYGYWRNSARENIKEPWSLYEVDGGAVLQGQRWVEGIQLLDVEAEYRGHRCHSFRACMPQNRLQARYRLRDNQLHWIVSSIGADGQEIEAAESLPNDCLLFPLLRAGTGFLLPQLANRACCVVVPWLRDPTDSRQLLCPLKSTRSAAVAEEVVNGLTHWRYFGGEYGDHGADCWLDRRGLMQRYCWASANGNWEVRLTEEWSADEGSSDH